MKTVFNVTICLISALIVLFAGLVLSAKVMGGGCYAVLSGSMEPEYHVGSLLYVLPCDTEKLKTGDVITFAVSDDMTATHRIASVNEGETLSFTTKGDANDTPDAESVDYRNVLGKPAFSIPLLGNLITFIKKPAGIITTSLLILLMLLLAAKPMITNKKNIVIAEPETKEREWT